MTEKKTASRTSCSWWVAHSTQRQPWCCNTDHWAIVPMNCCMT